MPMTFGEFQAKCRRTMDHSLEERDAIINYTMGIVGEAGEVMDYMKKVLFHGHKMDKAKVMEEVGDLCFYIAALLETLEISGNYVLDGNVDKLLKRYPDGFSQQASRQRTEYKRECKMCRWDGSGVCTQCYAQDKWELGE